MQQSSVTLVEEVKAANGVDTGGAGVKDGGQGADSEGRGFQ